MTKKITVRNPIVEMTGDEMARIMWESIRRRLFFPFLNLDLKTFDLSIQNRDKTNDQITTDAANAIKQYGVGIKCATITHTLARMKEFNSPKMLKSPNGKIRNILDGAIAREPIVCKNIPQPIPGWIDPILIMRHGSFDQYKAVDFKTKGKGRLTIKFQPETGDAVEYIINDFTGDGVAMGMFNTDESIYGFARACFNQALAKKWPLYFSAKDTILKEYDGRFKEIFQELYENEYKERFDAAGIFYEYHLIDTMMAKILELSGKFVWALKNYDGDVESDLLAKGYGSLGLMTSALVTTDGKTMESEAAHGTITDHFREYEKGNQTSTNPIASIFAWTRGLAFRGKLDDHQELIDFCTTLEKVCIDTIESGTMTKDLALLVYPGIELQHGEHYLYMEEFLDVIQSNFKVTLEKATVMA